MSTNGDPAGGTEDNFIDKHDLLLAGSTDPVAAPLFIPADKTTLTTDNGAMHTAKTASEGADAIAQQKTKDKNAAIGLGKKNYRDIRQRIMKHVGYTTAIGEFLGIERTQSAAVSEMSADGPQPVLRGRGLDTGGAEIKSTKGDAEAVDLYCERDGDTAATLLVRCLHFPYIDNRPLLVAGKPEKRTYTAMFIRHNQPYGRMSASITVIVSA